MRWFVRGDVDGFFGLALDNLVQLLVIHALCGGLLGFPDALLYGRVLPAVAVSLIVGNLFYAWQAKSLGDRLGRHDLCALPYGINTPSVFAYVFLVMLPVKLAATPAHGAERAAEMAWHAGLVACFGSGVIELTGAFFVNRLRRLTPRAAMLSTLAGIALTFIAIGFLFRTYAHPIVGLTTLAIILACYFGRVKIRGGIPAGLAAVGIGVALCWTTGVTGGAAPPTGAVSLRLPVPILGDLTEALRGPYLLPYLSVIVPMGLFNLVGSIMNLESAEAEGDAYPAAPSLAVNGAGTIAAACFGSCFPTTIYIGHPGWKAMGARAGYSILNAAFITALCVTGTVAHLAWAVPVEAAMAVVLWIGVVITAQAFSATPKAHAPAVVIGLLPGIAAWGALMMKSALRAAGHGGPDGPAFSEALLAAFGQQDIHLHGALALEQGFIFSAVILAAATVCVIERHWVSAAAWCFAGSLLAALGLMHSYRWTAGDTAVWIDWPWKLQTAPWAMAYALMGWIFLSARWLTVPQPMAEASEPEARA